MSSQAEIESFIPALPPPLGASVDELFNQLAHFQKSPHDVEVLRRDLNHVLAANQQVGKLTRQSGDAAVTHELYMAIRLASIGLPLDVQRAALFHDVPEDTQTTISQVKRMTNSTIAQLVEAVTKVKSGTIQSAATESSINQSAQDLTQEKLLEAIGNDPRSLYIKGADNTHNALTYSSLPSERRRKKANLSLEVYEPLLKAFGLTGYARTIGDAALQAVQPYEYEMIVRLQDEAVSQEMLTHLHSIAHTWTKMLFENNRLDFLSLIVELPSIYDIYQASPKVTAYKTADVLPYIKLVLPTKSLRSRWYRFLEDVYQLTESEKQYNPIPDLKNTVPVIKTIPLFYNEQPYQIKVILTTADMDLLPVYLDVKKARLSSHEREIARENLELIKENYRSATQGSKGTGTITEDVVESAKRGIIYITTPAGEKYTLPANSTLLDAAYAIGKNLGNCAVNGTVKRGARMIELTLSQSIETGDLVGIIINDAQQILPSRYDMVTTKKAVRDIRTAINRSLPEVKQDAFKRATQIILWLYKEKTQTDLDVDIRNGFENEFDDFLSQYYGSDHVFLEKLGGIAIPSQQSIFFDRWDSARQQDTLVKHAFRFVDNLITYRNNCSTLQIKIKDQKGVLSKIGGILEFMGISALPVRANPDHENPGAVILEVVFNADTSQSQTIVTLLKEAYQDEIHVILYQNPKK